MRNLYGKISQVIVVLIVILLFSSCKHWQHVSVANEGQTEMLLLDKNIGQEPFHCMEKRHIKICLSMFTIRFGRSVDMVILNKSLNDVHVPIKDIISEHDGQPARVIKYGSQILDDLSMGIALSLEWDHKQHLVLHPNEAVRLYVHFQYPHVFPPNYESIVSLAICFHDGTSEHFKFSFKYQLAKEFRHSHPGITSYINDDCDKIIINVPYQDVLQMILKKYIFSYGAPLIIVCADPEMDIAQTTRLADDNLRDTELFLRLACHSSFAVFNVNDSLIDFLSKEHTCDDILQGVRSSAQRYGIAVEPEQVS